MTSAGFWCMLKIVTLINTKSDGHKKQQKQFFKTLFLSQL